MRQSQLDLLRLHMNPGIGRATLFKLYRHFGCFSAAVKASSSAWQQAGIRADLHATLLSPSAPALRAMQGKIAAQDISIISYWDDTYPALLKTIYDPPAVLYIRGNLPDRDCFAIVGSRKATPAGLEVARELAGKLAAQGICIVSGMARGVDSAAHQGAVDVQGNTIAVLGCGVDHIYPRENTRLYHQIIDRGAVISEHPPGTGPVARHFPARNRMISGLARGVLIVEATAGSGSLITADFALDQGREIFATPGAIRHPNSQGPHQLLKDGAQLVTDSSDILQALWPELLTARKPIRASIPPAPAPRPPVNLNQESLTVYQLLGEIPLHHDEIARKCALTPMNLSAILLDLELRGEAKQLPGGHYIRGSLSAF
ncbi:DNA-processing protein DprA [Pelovirga terrestris]|uniref:DNA-protecting protein DprA n=1 Tax=Pelovirga terrestris TaxID=2771352 RepID=A0A8J6QMM1_9BACT|nr:DNA-processing protein DprA [Pelovirga terrestris]MBD1399758.1 DNA-protecting protein DprA [Pelovirga terrestris]